MKEKPLYGSFSISQERLRSPMDHNSTLRDLSCPVPFPCLDVDCLITDSNSIFMSDLTENLKVLLTNLLILPICVWIFPIVAIMSVFSGTMKKWFGSKENLNGGKKKPDKNVPFSKTQDSKLSHDTVQQSSSLKSSQKPYSLMGASQQQRFSIGLSGPFVANGQLSRSSLSLTGKKNDKRDIFMKEILELSGDHLLTDDEDEMDDGKENVKPAAILKRRNAVHMGTRVKLEFGGRVPPGRSQRVVSSGDPQPHLRNSASDLQNEIKNFQFKKTGSGKPEKKDVITPVPKPRYSLLQTQSASCKIQVTPKPRTLKPWEWLGKDEDDIRTEYYSNQKSFKPVPKPRPWKPSDCQNGKKMNSKDIKNNPGVGTDDSDFSGNTGSSSYDDDIHEGVGSFSIIHHYPTLKGNDECESSNPVIIVTPA